MPSIHLSQLTDGLRIISYTLLIGFLLSTVLLPQGRAEAASGWSIAHSQSSSLHGIFALSETNAWAVGANGTILHWDGANWTPQNSGVLGALWGVYALDPSHVWAVGDNGAILFSNNNGATWAHAAPGLTTDNLWGVYATSPSDVWALGGKDGSPSSGIILHFDGSKWSVRWQMKNSPNDVGMNAAWGLDPNHIWAVGNSGRILFWNGSSWSEQQSGVSVELSSITAPDSSNIWVSGRNGLILFYNGSTWSQESSGVTGYVTSISAADNSHIWASIQKLGTSPSSTILFRNGPSWAPRGGISEDIHAIHTLDSGRVWAAGMGGNIYSYSQPIVTPLKLTSPNGGQTFNAGSTTRITWDAPSKMTHFKLKMSKDAGATWKLIPGAESVSQSFFDWKVPALPLNSSAIKVKVAGFGAGGANLGADTSDSPFRIVVTNLVSPNGGATYRSGDTVQIRWNTYSTVAPIAKTKLQYSKDGGITWKPIQTLNDAQSSYNWTVPEVMNQKGKCLVRVVFKDSNNNTVGKDASDKYFTLKPR